MGFQSHATQFRALTHYKIIFKNTFTNKYYIIQISFTHFFILQMCLCVDIKNISSTHFPQKIFPWWNIWVMRPTASEKQHKTCYTTSSPIYWKKCATGIPRLRIVSTYWRLMQVMKIESLGILHIVNT